jgi:glycine/D-amino acid oxidase-like deaminating enzyme
MVPYATDNMRALLLPGIAEVDGRRLRACLVRALRKRGVVWREGVGRIVAVHGNVVGVEVGTERIATKRVVAATGAWPVVAGGAELAPVVTPVRAIGSSASYE